MKLTNGTKQPVEISHKLYWGVILLFLIVKLVWVMAPTFSMGIPRLGDDALVYLWKGVSSVHSPKEQLPAIQDVIHLRQLKDSPDAALDFERTRVTMRTTGLTSSPLLIATGGLLSLGINQKMAFALMELITSIVLALSIAISVSRLLGKESATLVLILLTFAILPNQGIHYLIPSVFALSLALLLWTSVLKHERAWLTQSLLAVLMLLTHPIGPVYILIALALVLGRVVFNRQITQTALTSVVVLSFSVLLWLGINWLVGTKDPATSGMGGVSLVTVGENLTGLAKVLMQLFSMQAVLGFLLLLGLGVTAIAPGKDPDSRLLITVLLAAFITTVIIDIPGYPGDLPSRILVALVVFSVGVAIKWLLEKLRQFKVTPQWGILVLAVCIASQLPFFVTYFYHNLNMRHQLLDENVLRAELKALPKNATIAWADTDTLMMAALLEGAGRYHFIPLPMVEGTPALRSEMNKAESLYIAAAFPERLNGLSILGWRSLEPRYYGYGFEAYRRVTLLFEAGVMGDFFLRVSGGRADELQLSADGQERMCNVENMVVNGDDELWVKVSDCGRSHAIHIESTNTALQITGLSLAEPSGKIRWPWGANGLTLKGEPRNPARGGIEVKFDFPYLFGESVAKELSRNIEHMVPLSDISGVVWLRVNAAK